MKGLTFANKKYSQTLFNTGTKGTEPSVRFTEVTVL